jgi:proteic killer suppression protein
VIISFRDREAARIWNGERSRRLPPWIHKAAIRRLRMLNEALTLAELTVFRGNRLEALSGDRLGQFSVRITDQWRICFRWTDRGPADVEIVDYHS